MAKLTRLQAAEPVHVDTRRLADIVQELGEDTARDMIGLALQQVTQGLEQLRDAVRHKDDGRITRLADQLARDAWLIGLITLSAVAMHVADCARSDGRQGLHALLARLERVGAESMARILRPDESPPD